MGLIMDAQTDMDLYTFHHMTMQVVCDKVGNLDSLIPCSFVVIDCDRRAHRQTWTDKYNGYCPILRGA